MTENATTPTALGPEQSDWCQDPGNCEAGPEDHIEGPGCEIDHGPETQLFRAKWMLDGATTLAEAAQKARDYADWLQGLHDQGYVLDEPVSDDYGFYLKPAE